MTSIIPYTLLFMRPRTLAPLTAAAAKPESVSGEETKALMWRWVRQNNLRVMLGTATAVLAIVASVMKTT